MAALVPVMVGGSRFLAYSEFKMSAFSLVSRTLGIRSVIFFPKKSKRVLSEGVCSQVRVILIPMLGLFGQITLPGSEPLYYYEVTIISKGRNG